MLKLSSPSIANGRLNFQVLVDSAPSVESFDLTLTFDPLEVDLSTGLSVTGPSGWSVIPNRDGNNVLIGGYTSTESPVSAGGTLLQVSVTLKSQTARQATVVWAGSFNDPAVAVPSSTVMLDLNAAPTGDVTISGATGSGGVPQQGDNLTAANSLADADGLGTISYSWKAGGSAISGATGSSFTLTQAEVGKKISVTASYTDAFGTAESKTSTETSAVLDVQFPPTGTVTISGATGAGGVPKQGDTLTVANTLADVDGIPTSGTGAITYQWYVGDSAINGATSTTFTLTQAQVGKAISVKASYTDLQGTPESKTSASTGAVLNVNDLPTGDVTISGATGAGGVPQQGDTLTAANTLADVDGIPPSGTGAITYQWYAGGSAISGATSSTFTLTQTQVGKAISVKASYTDLQGTAESKTSASTGAVLNVNDLPTGTVTISGTPIQGKTLTASNTVADADGIPSSGAGALAYQWYADGSAISGASGSSFKLTSAEVGKAITVKVSYTDLQNTSETVFSTATATVQAPPVVVAAAVEQAAPALIPGGIAGDGNGDGIVDSEQINVASAQFVLKGGSGGSTPVFVTLVADAASDGTASSTNASLITKVEQLDAPAELPKGMSMPLGLISFSAQVDEQGASVPFTLFVDKASGANGYWKQDSQGTWVNLASAPLGGSTTVVGDKIRLNFSIQDGGAFDGDHLVNGVVDDPGAAAQLPLSLIGYQPAGPSDGLWF